MSLVPALDLRPGQTPLPASIEAEQALLGVLLYDNDAFHRLEGVEPHHFHEPFHGRLFERIRTLIASGRLADPILMADGFTSDPAFEQLGGVRYLADLMDRAPQSQAIVDYGRVVAELAQRRDLISLGGEMANAARDSEIGPEAVISIAEAGLLAMQVQTRPMKLISAAQAAADVLADLDNPADRQAGVSTGLEPLDAHLGPLLSGDLVLLMGRPSMGKSAVAGCIALNVAQAGQGVIEINGEMTAGQMTRRHLTDLAQASFGARGPKYSDIRKRAVTLEQRQILDHAYRLIHGLPLLMIKRSGLKLSQLRSLVRRQTAAWAREGIVLGTVVIDHVGLIHPDQATRDRYADQTIVSNSLKALAEELGCPLIALNQMNRQNENRDDKRPQLSDLRDSGSWEQDADLVIGCYREAYYAQKQAEPLTNKAGRAGEEQQAVWAEWDRARRSRTVEAIVLKAREGETGTVKLWGDVARNAIRGAAPEDGDLL